MSLDGGERVECDAVLWATQAAAHRLLRDSGLPVDAAGFLRVRDTLQSVADPAVFGTGDCVDLRVASEVCPKMAFMRSAKGPSCSTMWPRSCTRSRFGRSGRSRST